MSIYIVLKYGWASGIYQYTAGIPRTSVCDTVCSSTSHTHVLTPLHMSLCYGVLKHTTNSCAGTKAHVLRSAPLRSKTPSV